MMYSLVDRLCAVPANDPCVRTECDDVVLDSSVIVGNATAN